MKTILLTLGILLLVSNVFAASAVEVWPATTNKACVSVSASSSTATAFLASRAARTAWSVTNPHATNTVYISTYAATAATAVTTGGAWHRIAANATYTEDNNPYTGAIYILTPSGQTAIVVSGEERWR